MTPSVIGILLSFPLISATSSAITKLTLPQETATQCPCSECAADLLSGLPLLFPSPKCRLEVQSGAVPDNGSEMFTKSTAPVVAVVANVRKAFAHNKPRRVSKEIEVPRNILIDRVANGGKLVHVLQEEESVLFNEEGNRSSPHCIFKLPLHDSGGEVKRFASQIDKITCITVWKGAVCTGSVDFTVRLWNSSGICFCQLAGHTDVVRCLLVCHDQRLLFSGSTDQSIHVWDVEVSKRMQQPFSVVNSAEHEECFELIGHTGPVHSLLEWEGKLVSSGAYDGTVRIWDIDSHQCVQVISAHASRLAVFNEQLYIFSYAVRSVQIWRLGERIRGVSLPLDPITFDFNHQFMILVTSTNLYCCLPGSHHVLIWDDASQHFRESDPGHLSMVTSICSWKGRLCSGSQDGAVRLWDRHLSSCMELKDYKLPVLWMMELQEQLLVLFQNGPLVAYKFRQVSGTGSSRLNSPRTSGDAAEAATETLSRQDSSLARPMFSVLRKEEIKPVWEELQLDIPFDDPFDCSDHDT